MDKIKQIVEEKIKEFTEVNENNVEMLYTLVDIHKDICNEEYWKKKVRYMGMRYRDYDDRRYRGDYGDEMLEDMRDRYGEYRDSRYSRGEYGTEHSMKSLDYMLKSVEQFLKMLKDEAGSQEEMQLIQKTTRKIGDM